MKKTILIALIAFITTNIWAQEPVIKLITEKKTGENLSLKIKVSKPEFQSKVWIDLNGNNIQDQGEQVTVFDESVNYTVQAKEINIYGPVWVLGCIQNNISRIDISRNTQYLSQLYCGYNLINELDLSANQKLSLLSCFNNRLKSIKLSDSPKLKTINVSGNCIDENNMLEIVTSLKTHDKNKPGEIIITNSNKKEQNVITDQMVQVLKEKGWKVYKLVKNKKEVM